MTYDAVVFDNDGVLVEPAGMDVLREAAHETFAALGVADPDPDDVDAITYGVTPEILQDVCSRYDLEPAGFWRRRDVDSSRAQRAAMRAGLKAPYEDLGAVAELDRPLGIVSSNQQATVDYVMERFAIGEHVATAYGRESGLVGLHRKKPEPYYLERALDDLGAERALYVGDSETDVEAAARAGIDSAFVWRPHRDGQDLSVTPTHEIDSLWELPDLLRA